MKQLQKKQRYATIHCYWTELLIQVMKSVRGHVICMNNQSTENITKEVIDTMQGHPCTVQDTIYEHSIDIVYW